MTTQYIHTTPIPYIDWYICHFTLTISPACCSVKWRVPDIISTVNITHCGASASVEQQCLYTLQGGQYYDDSVTMGFIPTGRH